MDTNEVGVLVHKVCGEPAFNLTRAPLSHKILQSHIGCDVNGNPVHPDTMRCPACHAEVSLNGLQVRLFQMNGSRLAV